MPSPFPGMDPYLEGDLSQEFHETLAGAIRAQLMPRLTPKYIALLATRYVLNRPALGVFDLPSASRIFYPDVHVAQVDTTPTTPGTTSAVVTPPTAEVPSPTLVPQLSIEIRDVAQRRLVTIIEILSPANKIGDGAGEYNDRRVDLLQARTHLIEIDLLRGGMRIVLGEMPPAPYYAYLSRVERRPFTLVWAIELHQRLPILPVPLIHPDPDVTLDLQAAVDACFALVGYERLIDYLLPPPPPDLGADDATWLQETLRAAGLRPT